MVETFLAFAILHGGYTDWCQNVANGTCIAPQVQMVQESPFVHANRKGWYTQGTAYVKERSEDHPAAKVLEDATMVHEIVHHLQRLSNRYHGYRGACNQYKAEEEAYRVAAAYALTKGWKVDYTKSLEPHKSKCYNGVAAGLIKKPDWM